VTTPKTVEVVARWVEKAEHDLLTAEHTMTLPPDRCPYDTVAFHAQQCAEKYLKALLVARNVDVPKTHDLAVLVSRLAASGQPTAGITPALIDQLNPFAVTVRYPDDLRDVERADAEGALVSAHLVRTAARTGLQLAGFIARD
jgi:HEPN domain-containing protein